MKVRKYAIALGSSALLLALICATPKPVSAYQKGQPSEPAGTAARRPARTYDVEHYIIRTRFDRSKKAVYGDVSVRLRALNRPINSFELDAGNLKVDSVVLESDSSALVWKSTTTHLSIHLPRAYDSSEPFSVRIVYSAQPKRGLYFIPGIKNAPTIPQPPQIWSQGEAEDNHFWFPCYDFPDDKATVEQYITTTAPNEMAVGNGTLVKVDNNANGTRTFHWSMDQVFSSYLISLVIGDYGQIKDKLRDIAIEYNTYRGSENVAKRVFAKTPAMMRYFEKVLDYPFPYKRYAQTVVASFIFGGMENITATTHADTEILWAAPDDPPDAADDLISHELSHSWFGDLVTCRDWSELWLNEGLATFMEASFKESEKGREGYLTELKNDQLEYFAEETVSRRHPLVNKYYTTGSELFDATTYKKGGWVIHMLRETVGDQVFWRALNVYLNEFKYGNVISADLEAVFERVSGRDLGWFFNQWVYQSGYPELSINYHYDLVKKSLLVTVAQTQKPISGTPEVFRLPLEIQLKTSHGVQTVLADVTKREQTFNFDLPEDPISVEVDPNLKLLKRAETKSIALPRAA
jgi:aminopeptidase N